jgi:hypothetical protein
MSLPVPDLQSAFKIETTIELVDHEGLGIVVSELNSIEQADFFSGLAEGFSRYEDAAARGRQLAYISGELTASPGIARGVIELLRDLADAIDEVTK